MSLFSESGRAFIQAFRDWVNADSFDIPPEIVYAPKADDHGHGHDDHGHDAHGHDGHCHGEAHAEEHAHGDAHEAHAEVHEAHGHDEHGHDEHAHHATPSLPQPSREEARAKQVAEINARDLARQKERAYRIRAKQLAKGGEAEPDEPAIYHNYKVIAFISGIVLVLFLLVTVAMLPHFGAADAPAVNEVSRRYLEAGLSETGAVNTVAGIILDYRAFDTLGESVVLFTATVTVIFLLQQFRKKKEEDTTDEYKGVRSLPARVIIAVTFPFIMLYGIYVVVNGHLSPGGGFSGGAILGGGLILSHLALGEKHTEKFVTVNRCTKIMAAGLFTYIALKTVSILTGANGIELGIPLGTPGSLFSSGLIFPLNICVGLVVACTMYSLYNLFTNWQSERGGTGKHD